MLLLPIELWQLILDLSELEEQLVLTSINKLLHKSLKITDFYHIKPEKRVKLTDDILKRYYDIKYLDASGYYCQITNEGMVVSPPNIFSWKY